MTNAEVAILGLVVERPRHGYQIEQVIEKRGMRMWTDVGFSSIYFLLKKLERQKFIKGEWERTDASAERWIKVYHPTQAGREAFHSAILEALSVPQPGHRPLLLGLANFPAISIDEALSALSQYRQYLKEKMEILGTVRESKEHVHPYHVDAMFELSLSVLQAELKWAEKFVQQLQAKSEAKQEQKV